MKRILGNPLGLLILLALLKFALHLATNGEYGFHRDELAMLDNARRLDWGYVAYPPLAPFLARIELELFGPNLTGFRFFSALAVSAALVLTGLMAWRLGGGWYAQATGAVAAGIAPIVLIQGALFQYVSFDYLWWVLVAYCVISLLQTDDPRWWLGIGTAIGLGMMTRYTMAFLAVSLAAGILLTPVRRWLRTPWPWAGAAISILIFLPNLLWQIQHQFISLEFLASINARDVSLGRTAGYLPEQFFVSTNPFTIPMWVSGLYVSFFRPPDRRYRLLGWLFLIPFLLLLVTGGRSYYLAPAYPPLFALGAVASERRLAGKEPVQARRMIWQTAAILVAGLIVGAGLMLPLAPINSGWWQVVNQVHDNFREQLGWPELVESVSQIHSTLSQEEGSPVGILAGNYGEAGAINLYGPAYGLPQAISAINSHWLRGYGENPPQTLIVLGYSQEEAGQLFEQCSVAGRITNRYGVENEETLYHEEIFVCRGTRKPWPEMWAEMRRFG